MVDEQFKRTGALIDTTINFREDVPVSEHIFELRKKIRERLETTFESLPEVVLKPFAQRVYRRNNPQAVIFIPEKDLNMFPVVLQEAKAFANETPREDDVGKRMGLIREHEFEHLQKAYELGLGIKGIGMVMMKYKGKPIFGGFVTCSEGQEISLRDDLRVRLAPKTLAFQNTDDMLGSQMKVLEALKKSRSWEEIDQIMNDVFFVISERYLPRKVHNFLQGIGVHDKR